MNDDIDRLFARERANVWGEQARANAPPAIKETAVTMATAASKDECKEY